MLRFILNAVQFTMYFSTGTKIIDLFLIFFVFLIGHLLFCC